MVVLKFIAKYWKQIIIALLLVFLALSALSLLSDGLMYKKELKALRAQKTQELKNQEKAYKETIASYQDTLKKRDAKIDSFDIEIAKKKIQIIEIHEGIQLLKGDSIGIIAALNRVFAR